MMRAISLRWWCRRARVGWRPGQRASALLRRETAQFAQCGPPRDQFVHIGVEAHDFHERDPSVVSLLLAASPAARLVQRLSAGGIESQQASLSGIRMVGFLAAAQRRRIKSLSDHTDQMPARISGFQSQIQQRARAPQRRVGVQRAEKPGDRSSRPAAPWCRVGIANLAHQNDIGILSHHGTDAGRKIDFQAVPRLVLPDHRHRIFHRILERHDVDALGVEGGRSNRGGGLAAAGGPVTSRIPSGRLIISCSVSELIWSQSQRVERTSSAPCRGCAARRFRRRWSGWRRRESRCSGPVSAG